MPGHTTNANFSPPSSRRRNGYSCAPQWHSAANAGTISDAFGHRVVVTPIELIGAIHEALTHEVGDAAGEILSKIGSAAGSGDMRAFMERADNEFGAELPKVHMGVALQTWWWPWLQSGWGRATFDLQRAAQRLVRIDVADPAIARAQRSRGQPVCHLLAGFFAGAFGQLSGREVGSVEIQCRAAGATTCRFLVTTRGRASSAVSWRDSGVSVDEIERRIADAAKDRVP